MISEAVLMDNMEYMAQFPDKFFDLAVVNPPYGININESIGRYKGQKHSGAKKVNWDNEIPNEYYFNELFRISRNQIIWGGNYFNLNPCKCFLIWDKVFSEDLSFSMYEFAWTSFNSTSKGFKYNPANDRPKNHPTQKPVALYDWIYAKYLPEGGKVLDTHLGSGSNRIAADKAGNIDFYSCELDSDYHRDQEKRWKDYKSQLVLQF